MHHRLVGLLILAYVKDPVVACLGPSHLDVLYFRDSLIVAKVEQRG